MTLDSAGTKRDAKQSITHFATELDSDYSRIGRQQQCLNSYFPKDCIHAVSQMNVTLNNFLQLLRHSRILRIASVKRINGMVYFDILLVYDRHLAPNEAHFWATVCASPMLFVALL